MSTVAFFVSFIVLAASVSAQIFRLDDRDFPTVRVWYIPQGAAQMSPPIALRDNGISVVPLQHECMQFPARPVADLTLCLDVSSSNAVWHNGRAILDTIATVLASRLQRIVERIHLVTFNTTATATTVEVTDLPSTIQTTLLQGGTDYAAAFMKSAHPISPPTKGERWLVFVTDGLDTVDHEQVRAFFNGALPRIIVLAIRNEVPQSLRDLARESDGGWFELISAPAAAAAAAENICRLIRGEATLCNFRYEALATCDQLHDVQVEFPRATYGIRYSTSRTGRVEISTSHVYFGIPLLGTERDAIITVTARGLPVRFDTAWIEGSPNFIVATPVRAILLPDQGVALTVRYRARDTSAAWGELHIRTSCGEHHVTFSVGRRFARFTPSAFRIASPASGTRYFSGSDMLIRWFGIPPDDTCRISVAFDGSSSWQLLTTEAHNLRYRWKVPPLDRPRTARFRVERVGTGESVTSELVTLEPPSGILRPTDFGQATIGTRKDSVFRAFITNPSTTMPLVIERLEFIGDHSKDFGIAQGVFPLSVPPGGTADVELYFRPSARGKRSAEVLLTSPSGYIRELIWGHGIGVAPLHFIVDFGAVPIGTQRNEELDIERLSPRRYLWSGDSSAFTIEHSDNLSLLRVVFRPDSVRVYRARLLLQDTATTATIELQGRGIIPAVPAYAQDPTRFRTLLLPTAEPLAPGTMGIGTFDGVGLLGMYAPIESIAIYAGGLIPVRIGGQRSYAYGIGARGCLPVNSELAVGAGIAAAQSIGQTREDSTTISLLTPFVHATWKIGKARINAGLGYAFKEHKSSQQQFRADAMIVALGGDVQIAERWKLAADMFRFGSVESLPIALSARFLGDRFAIDGGCVVAIPTASTERLFVLPLISALWMLR